ncbi:unnamed protein product, partial [Medioppia subpectinata]
MYRCVALVLIGIAYTYGTDVPPIPSFAAIDANDIDVREALLFAFGPNKPKEKQIELLESKKIYKLKVMVSYFRNCSEEDLKSVWVIKTPDGCKTTQRCEAEVIQLNSVNST